jgi:transposase
LKLYVYGYLNRVQSGRRLERGAGRNVELMWLLGRLVPTTRRSPISGRTTAVRSAQVCARFVELCRERVCL